MRRSRPTRANALMDELRGKLATLPGTTVRGMTIAAADDFAYHDPVDGSVSKNQGIRILFEGGSRVVFRLSGTGTSGRDAARLYRALRARSKARHGLDTQEALADLIAAADDIAGIRSHTGRNEAERDHLMASTEPAGRWRNRDSGATSFRRRSASASPSGRARRHGSGSRSSMPSGNRETDRIELARGERRRLLRGFVPGLKEGTRYGFRADGDYAPERGLWFDPDKLLVDPYAVEIDRPYVYDAEAVGAARRGRRHRAADAEGDREGAAAAAADGAAGLPARRPDLRAARPRLHHAATRTFPKRPARARSRRSRHPAVIEHLQKLGVSAVELMPVTAWIDERHLPPLGLTNAWGYNPVTFMALDPRLAPGGLAELRETVAALREAGIGVILDLVFNHTGESDVLGPTLSLRGLDSAAYYRHARGDRLAGQRHRHRQHASPATSRSCRN